MSEYDVNAQGRELDWDDQIENDGTEYNVVPEGDYEFRVDSIERARHSGSDKIPPCNKAVVKVTVWGEGGSTQVTANLFLYSKFEWKLCQFFTAIGHRRRGEPLRMNWARVTGATGKCRVTVRKWTSTRDGREYENNEIGEFYEPEETPATSATAGVAEAGGRGAGYTPGQF